jgi:trans-L-3-hydroxyproline dehydratase
MKLEWNLAALSADKRILTSIDAHAAGEPLRIVIAGMPDIPGRNMLEKRQWMIEHGDPLRRILMHEPRGHFDMYGAVVTPPVAPGADVGVLFLHNEGYSTMCGHGVIALVTVLIEAGVVPIREAGTPIVLDTPAGLVRAVAHAANGRVEKVSFRNVPSFLSKRDVEVAVPGPGRVVVDLAFGGAFYAILPASSIGLTVSTGCLPALVTAASAIKGAIQKTIPIEHPLEKDLGFLYGVIFTDEPEEPFHHSRNLCVFANREVDRSPTGTGVSARLAVLHAKEGLAPGTRIAIESILGSRSVFEGRIVERVAVGPYEGVVPEVAGTAFVTGCHQFLIDKRDPLGGGFLL